MAIRTTIEKVRNILLDNYDGVADLTPFIEAASSITDDVNSCASDRSISLGSTALELIERWLAAHFYVAADPLYSSRKTSKASGEFQGRNVTGGAIDNIALDTTDYGRRAKMLDKSGCLASLSMGERVQGFWLGLAPSDQTDYVDRD